MSKKPAQKKSLKRIASSSTERNVTLISSALVASGKIAFGNLYRKAAASIGIPTLSAEQVLTSQVEYLVGHLARMKGSAQKFGQLISIIGESFFSEDILVILRKLQSDTPGLAWPAVEKALRRQLGAQRLSELDINPEPIAAASIGQVHLATIKKTGEEIVLKIQYPGIDKTIDSDIRTLKTLLTGLALVPGLPALEHVFDEIKEMMHREVDYHRERSVMEDFRKILADDPRYIVPKVYPDYCSKRVLATQYQPGWDIASSEVLGLPESERSALAEAFLALYFMEFFTLGHVQTDPHFGNYRVDLSDPHQPKFILYDFGAMRKFNKRFVGTYAAMVKAALAGDKTSFETAANSLGLLGGDGAFSQHLWTVACIIIDPFKHPGDATDKELFDAQGRYHWGNSNLGKRVSQFVYAHKLEFNLKQVPHELIFLDRKLAGVYTMIAKLNAPTRSREILLNALS